MSEYAKGVQSRYAYFSVEFAQPPGFRDYTLHTVSIPHGLTVQVQLKEGEVNDIINAMETYLVDMDQGEQAKHLDVLEFRQSDDESNIWLLTFGFVQAYTQITIPFNGSKEAQKFLDELKQFIQAKKPNPRRRI